MHIFFSTEAPLTLFFFAFFATIPPFMSLFPCSIEQFGPRYCWSSVMEILGVCFYLFSFFLNFFLLFLHIKHAQCRQLFGCLHGGQKFCRCVAQMPHFPSVACLELWFVGSLACRATSSSFLENCTKRTQWSARQEQDVTPWSSKGL